MIMTQTILLVCSCPLIGKVVVRYCKSLNRCLSKTCILLYGLQRWQANISSVYPFNMYEPSLSAIINDLRHVRRSSTQEWFDSETDATYIGSAVGLVLLSEEPDEDDYRNERIIEAWWLIGRFVAFRPEGRGFESRSSRYTGISCTDQVLPSQSPLEISREPPPQYPC